MPKPAGSGLLSTARREARLTVSPLDTGTRPSVLRFNQGNHTYYDGKRWMPSVTGITGKAEDKEKLLNWTAEMVATCAIEQAAEVSRLRRLEDDEVAHEWLSKAAIRYRDSRGVNGSDLHDVVDRKLSGQDIPEYLHEDIRQMADSAIAFLTDYQVETLFSEVRLANRTLGYCGTTDVIGIVPVYGDRPRIVDWKTAESMYRRPNFSRGKNAMQLTAYRGAEVMFWDDRTESDMIDVDDVGLIVMIRPEGYKVEDFDLTQAWPQFERAVANYHWWRGAESLGRPARKPIVPDLLEVLRNVTSREEALALHARHRGDWTPEHTAAVPAQFRRTEGAA